MPPEPECPRPDPIADVLGVALPPVCVPGVVANLRLRGEHWARLRQPVDPAA